MRKLQLFNLRWRKLCFLLLFFTILSAPLFAQNFSIKGKVVDEHGESLPGASVRVTGGTAGVTADVSGNFVLNAPADTKNITISFIGYITLQRAITPTANDLGNIVLVKDSRSLNDIVVIGYGTQRRKDVTGSIASVSAATLSEVPSPNLIDQLKGRTAGVDIVSNGSTPGSDGQIRIRGNRTITNPTTKSDQYDAPLIVLDGIPYPGNINDFSPEDIVNIDILKDASATAIYGSRGANGVIMVTTKRGKTGKTIISYDAYYGDQKALGEYPVYDGPGYAKFKQDAATYNTLNPGQTAYALTPSEQAALTAGVSTDWQKLIYRTAPTQSHQFGISGGDDATQFNVGAGYYRQDGIVVNQYFSRADLRTTIDHRISKYVKVGINSINSLRYQSLPGGGGVPGGIVRITPLASVFNADGSVNLFPNIGGIDAASVSPYTLISKASSIYDLTRRFSTFNSLYGEVNIIDGLKFRANAGLNFIQENGNSYNGTLTWTNSNASLNNANLNNNEQWNVDIQNLLTYNKVFGGKHHIDFIAGYEYTKNHTKNSNFGVTGVPADYLLNSDFYLASGTITASSVPGANGFSEDGQLSYMGRLAYGFDDRYNITLTIRRDASSALAPGHQWFTYPAVGLGWNITNESFMKDVTWLNNLKLRGGYGVSGNHNVGPYTTLGSLGASAYNFGTSGGALAYTVNTLPNPLLTWESTGQADIGLEFAVLNNRISGSIDVYNQNTKNILLGETLLAGLGAPGGTTANIGKTNDKGIEINLSTVNIQSNTGFTWRTDYSFAANREKITQLPNNEPYDIGNGWFVGQPLTVIYDVKKIGIWQTIDKTDGTLAKQTSPVQFPGQIRVQDVDGNGIINAADRQIIGNFQPQWEGGLTNTFSYKAIDLSVVMYARMGMKVLLPYLTDDGGANGYAFFNQGRVNQVKTNYWTPTNPTNGFPAPDASTDRFDYASTLGYYDGSFIKCRAINLGYTLPSEWVKKISMTSLRVYANVTNPFIIYSPIVKDGLALDPEGNGYGGSVTSNAGGNTAVASHQISVNLNNPSTRMFTIGVNAKF